MGLLRLFLAIAVLEHHLATRTAQPDSFGLGLVYGGQAVQIFFIISGFYMALVLHEKYNRPGDYLLFIQQRFLRLYPTFLLVLVLVLGSFAAVYLATSKNLGALVYYEQFRTTQSTGTYLLYGLSNFTGIGQDWLCLFRQDVATGHLYFGLPPPGTVTVWCLAFLLNPPVWSLSVEFTFYLIAPFLVLRSVYTQAAWMAASVALRYALQGYDQQAFHPWLTYFPPADLGFFLAGSIAYRLSRAHLDRLSFLGSKYGWAWLPFGALLLFYRRLPDAHDFDVLLIPLCAAMVPLLFALTRDNRVDRLIGELSYAFYLVHWNMIILLEAVLGDESSPFFEPICLLATLTVATLIYWFFERWIDRWRERRFRARRSSL